MIILLIISKALGERVLPSAEMRPQEVHGILFLASAIKLVTTVAALQCVKDGLLTLTGDLSSVTPDLTSKQILTGLYNDGSTPIL